MIIDKPLRKCELSQSRDRLAVRRCAAIPNIASRISRVALNRRRRSIDLVTASLQTRRHRAVVVAPDAIDVSRLHSAARLGGIESGLPLCPAVALETIRGLLIVGLPILGVNDQIVGCVRCALRSAGRRR